MELKNAQNQNDTIAGSNKRAGLALPDFETYYKAAKLVWLREWITLKDKRLLLLEGHDLHLGWHNFIWYNKGKTQAFPLIG